MTVKTKRILCLLALSLLVASVGMAAFTNQSADIAYRDGNPTPSKSESHINNYLFQDEQVNVAPTDGELRVMRTDQKVMLNDFVTKLIPVKNVAVRELRPIAREICKMEGGFAQVVQDKVKKQYWVEATCPAWQMPYVEAAVKALDKDWLNATDDGSAVVRYKGKNRGLTTPNAIALAYAGGSSQSDSLENTVTHLNDPSLAGAWEAIMKATDLPENEIKVDAEFVEVNTNNDLKLGVDYIAWKNGPGRNLFEFVFAGMHNYENFRGVSSIYNPLAPASIASKGKHVNFETEGRQRYAGYNAWLTSAYFDFLRSKGVAKSVMRTTLRGKSGQIAQEGEVSQVLSFAVTGDNDKWAYENGKRLVPVLNENGQPQTDQSGKVIYTLSGDIGDQGAWDRFLNYTAANKQVGMFVTIFPMIGLETTEMYVDATVSEVTGYTPQKLPMISKQSITSDVRTKDGESLLLAGLKRTEKVHQSAGAPWLSSIPVLGYLFGGETNLNRATDIVVTLNTTTGVQGAEKKTAIAMAETETKAVAQAEGTVALEVPKTSFGYDMWLLDKDKKAEKAEK